MAQLARGAINDSGFQSFVISNFSTWQDLMSWVSQNFVYREEGEEIIRSPQVMLADMGRRDNGRIVSLEGDCDDISTFNAAVTCLLHYPSRFVAIRVHEDNPEFEHVFSQCWDLNQWITLDATVKEGTVLQPIQEMIVNVC